MWLALMVPASAQQLEIQNTINSQLKALQADDFNEAFRYASPNIKQMFGTSDRFAQMVTQGYPMVHRPQKIEFKELKIEDFGPVQHVLITDQSGRLFLAKYAMIQTENGWRINGVELLESGLVGV